MAKKIDYASLYTLRKDGRYMARYTDDRGRHYLYDRNPEQLHKKLQAAMEAKDAPHVATFREVAEAWEEVHREEIEVRTWKNYKPHYEAILAEHGDRAFSDIEAVDIVNDLARAKAQGWSYTVVNSRRSIWRMIFDYAVVHGEAQYNPVASIKLPKGLKRGKRTAPTDEQIQIICNNIDAPFGLFPFLLLCTGLRKSEGLALQWRDIDFETKEIQIVKSIDYTNSSNPKYKTPKSESGIRIVPMVDILIPPLKAAYKQRTGDYVFPAPPSNRGGKGGGLMSEHAYEGAYSRYCKAVGLIGDDGNPVITAHNLRHGTATLMFELGVDELTAQKILGHSRVEITREIYTELRNKQKVKSIGKFNKGLSELVSNHN